MTSIVTNVGIESIGWEIKTGRVDFPRDKAYHPVVSKTVSALDRLMSRDRSLYHRMAEFARPSVKDRSITYPENYQGVCRRSRKLIRMAKNRSKSSKNIFDGAEDLLDEILSDYELFNSFRFSLAQV